MKHINLHFQETKWTLSNIDYKENHTQAKLLKTNQTYQENLETNQRKMTNYIQRNHLKDRFLLIRSFEGQETVEWYF